MLVFVLQELLLALTTHLPLFQMLMDLPVLELGLNQLHAHQALNIKTHMLFSKKKFPLVASSSLAFIFFLVIEKITLSSSIISLQNA